MSTTTTTTPTTMPHDGGALPPGHLGTSWEIAVVVVIIAIAATVIGTAMWQIPKRRRRRRRQKLVATEEGRSESQKEQPLPDGIRLAGEGSSHRLDEASEPLAKPRPTLSPYHHSKSLSRSPTDHRSTQPQRYYWSP